MEVSDGSRLQDHKLSSIDLHPGNVAFAQPGPAHINNFLIEPPPEHEIRRKDELPTPAHLPQRVCEPQDVGFGPGVVKILDFGHSFRPVNGAVYPATVFPSGTPRPPELLSGQKAATLPFKADSWYLGQLIYFILTHGWCLFPSSIGSDSEDALEEYKDCLTKLHNGQDNLMNQLPLSVKEHFTPYVLALLEIQPQMRLSISDLRWDKLFMETAITL
ncbi:Protein kinase-like domain protein [Metarhizium album ARSEF 1941]|uniref:Protein kinase-like domain protein n=1 Tax=Metarhizium album (strain ARSEF 1941) TaxID=1081103 RepID=A0A0B2WUV7_METAS|nr:Protein kinase-like domain protein [Metarhizium album ARSEF 1941]KHN97409.1 Protein kinase-like domain protein [Metarhizium album ARSEF 1941]